MNRSAYAVPAVALSASLALGACASGTAGGDESAGGTVPVTAAFYPLEFAAQRIGGDLTHVAQVTKPGAEPHDLELTPKQVGEISKSRVVFYEKGFQPALDEALGTLESGTAFDVSGAADLQGGDPHFWLDPVRYASVVTAMGQELATKDSANAATYTANAAALVADLSALDGEFRARLTNCADKHLVTGHAAFGYLASRYGFTQVSIAGVSPDAEPNAAQMRRIVEEIRANKVGTVYAETLVSPALAETIAKETGATVAVLDPIEGLTDESQGKDYLAIMRSNLEVLSKGQRCS